MAHIVQHVGACTSGTEPATRWRRSFGLLRPPDRRRESLKKKVVSEKLKTCILVMDGRRESIEGGTGDKNGGAYGD